MGDSSIMVSAPARLHLGLVKTSEKPGTTEPRFIAAGLSLASPKMEMEVTLRFDGSPSRDPVSRGATAVLRSLDLKGHVYTRSLTPLPIHQGFGSGTRMALAAAAGALRLAGKRIDILPMTRLSGRGGRSAMGAVLFAQGGVAADMEGRILRAAAPGEWRVVLISPVVNDMMMAGIHGPAEDGIIQGIRPCSPRVRNSIEDEAVAGLIGGTVNKDFVWFENAVASIQSAAARQFGKLQGGAASTESGRVILRKLRKEGIKACGQSSWGPTLFAITATADHAKELENWLAQMPQVHKAQRVRINNSGRRLKQDLAKA